MALVPAFCNHCDAMWDVSSLFAIKGATVQFEGNMVRPCPKCGQEGRIPDGIFAFRNNTIQVLSAPQRTMEDLARLELLLQDLRDRQVDADTAADQIQETAPWLTWLADFIRTHRSDIYQIIQIWLAVIALRMMAVPNEQTVTKEEMERMVDQGVERVVQEWEHTSLPKQSKPSQHAEPRDGRTEKPRNDQQISKQPR